MSHSAVVARHNAASGNIDRPGHQKQSCFKHDSQSPNEAHRIVASVVVGGTLSIRRVVVVAGVGARIVLLVAAVVATNFGVGTGVGGAVPPIASVNVVAIRIRPIAIRGCVGARCDIATDNV